MFNLPPHQGELFSRGDELCSDNQAQVQHYPETRASPGGYSTVPDPSGSRRVDMLLRPVAAARAAVATGAWVKSKHDMHLIPGSVGAYKLYF